MLYKVTAIKTSILVHIIEANSFHEALSKMKEPGHPGLKDILEDDFRTDYEAEVYVE